MNNVFIKFKKVFFSVLAIIGIFTLSQNVIAQTSEKDTLSFGAQIERLASAIDNFANALKATTQTTDSEEEIINLRSSGGFNKEAATQCDWTYGGMNDDLPSSHTKNENATWSAYNFPTKQNINGVSTQSPSLSQFVDLNGDGLLDYLFIDSHPVRSVGSWNPNTGASETYLYNIQRSCVYLNNGQGWDIEYRCFSELDSISHSGGTERKMLYRGDCADVS